MRGKASRSVIIGDFSHPPTHSHSLVAVTLKGLQSTTLGLKYAGSVRVVLLTCVAYTLARSSAVPAYVRSHNRLTD